MSRPSKVYVVQEPKPKGDGWTPDLTPAKEFGELVYVFDEKDRPSQEPREAFQKAKARLKDFDPRIDFLLCPGGIDPASQWVVIMHLMGDKFKLNFLYWSRRRQDDGRFGGDNGFYMSIKLDASDGK